MGENKTSHIIAISGWVVAVLSLSLNFLKYNEEKAQHAKAQQDQPIYEKAIKTYDPAILPPAIVAMKEPIRHEFEVTHKSGQPIKNLSIEFGSPDAEIIDINIIEGQLDTEVKLQPGAHEAKLKKPELLRDKKLRGYVVTKGITKLNMTVGADNAEERANNDIGESRGNSFTWESIYISIIITLFFGGIVFLLYKSLPALKQTGIFESAKGNSNYFLLILIATFVIIPIDFISPQKVFWGIMLYILITRWKQIKTVMAKIQARLDQIPIDENKNTTVSKPSGVDNESIDRSVKP